MTQKKINLQIQFFGMTDILLTLRNSKTRDSVEYRDSEFESKNSPRDKCPPEAGVSTGGRGHAPLGNFVSRKCDFHQSEGQVKVV